MISQSRKTREIQLGSLKIGGQNRVSVQTMLTEGLDQPDECIRKINELEKISCDVVRIAVRNSSEIKNVRKIIDNTNMPLVADIQFKISHAIEAIEAGFHGVRINPGYIKDKKEAVTLLDAANKKKACIRLGLNSGSLSNEVQSHMKDGMSREDAIVAHLEKWVEFFDETGFSNYKISVKSSSIEETVRLNQRISEITDAPLHLGVTEAGNLMMSSVRSSIAFARLLDEGIGDTIRVSITGNPIFEVMVAKEILRSLGLGSDGVNVISCPMCSRCNADLEKIVEEVTRKTAHINRKINLAIMGCAVNGPGEAKEADVGIAGMESGRFALFKKGRRIKNIDAKDAVNELISEILKDYE